jgi:uroporphyrin-III C-methyltransferase/precorrin-2 dehydrogenase/sirohydrochlorin ferrochelatase/uroporphyrin-III C-methyltransferase
MAGRVALIGCGPGDPELLTLKARRLIGEADVVVYDRLVAAPILDLVPAGVARIDVGKAAGRHPCPQPEINDLLVRLAASGRRVARLKGGDPFVFGRSGEEAEALARHGIAVEVVPGVTAASGCAATLGIPLTHRDVATGVRFVTGHRRDDGALDLDWDGLADPDTTLVFYMGLANLPEIALRLMVAGLPGSTPAAVVASGTTPEERICVAPLAELPARAIRAGLEPPALVVVGRVVALAAAWREGDERVEDQGDAPRAAAYAR